MDRITESLALAAEHHGDQPALVDSARTFSWREVQSTVTQLERTLLSLGVRSGDRIAVVENNRPELQLLILANIHLGAVTVLISPRFPETTRNAMIKSVGGRILEGWDKGLISINVPKADGARQMSTSADSHGALGTPPNGWDLSPWMPRLKRGKTECSPAHEEYPVPRDGPTSADSHITTTASARPAAGGPTTADSCNSPATIVFTSGSTGTPKAVLHTIGNHYFSALGSNEMMPVGPGDRWLLALPLYHVGGLGIFFRCLLGGATVVIERRGTDLVDQIVKDRITHLSLVPTQLRRLLQHPDLGHLCSSLKVILLGGAPIPYALLKEALEIGLPIYPSYGLTEMTSQVATATPHDPNAPRVLPYREVTIADNGAICVRGETLFLGYITSDGIERSIDADGWFHTGDIGSIDSRGSLHVLGRRDNMFISGGENIHPEQIEAALEGIEGIDEAVVVPIDDPEYGQRPVAFLRYCPDFNLSEIESDLSEETRFGFDHQSLSTQLEKTLPRFMLPIVYYPWPQAYKPAGIKHDRPFFRELAARLHRNKR